MTTIVCNKEGLFGDLQFTGSNGLKFKGKSKVYQFKAHPGSYPVDFIVGFAGTASDMVPIISYFTNPDQYKSPPRARNIGGLVLTANKEIFVFDDYTKWIAVDQPYYAIGTGSTFAMGAMATGCTPKEAIKVAMKHDAYTGMGIKGFTI